MDTLDLLLFAFACLAFAIGFIYAIQSPRSNWLGWAVCLLAVIPIIRALTA